MKHICKRCKGTGTIYMSSRPYVLLPHPGKSYPCPACGGAGLKDTEED
jgi:DnaJ-class molecular chaperone